MNKNDLEIWLKALAGDYDEVDPKIAAKAIMVRRFFKRKEKELDDRFSQVNYTSANRSLETLKKAGLVSDNVRKQSLFNQKFNYLKEILISIISVTIILAPIMKIQYEITRDQEIMEFDTSLAILISPNQSSLPENDIDDNLNYYKKDFIEFERKLSNKAIDKILSHLKTKNKNFTYKNSNDEKYIEIENMKKNDPDDYKIKEILELPQDTVGNLKILLK